MSEFELEQRPQRGSSQAHGRHKAAETEAATSAPQPSRLARIPFWGKRAGALTAACALLIGVGAAGQASEPIISAAVSDIQPSAEATADSEAKLSFEKAEIKAQPAPATAPADISVAPQAAEPAPAPAPEPAPAPAPAPAPEPAPVVAVNDPAGAQAYAAGQLASYGWSADQMQCLQTLWTKESDWTTTATNPSSGAYGIVQSLPAEKMASAGADYLTNYRTQINWGLNYIKERYQSPCGALNFHLSNNWY